VGEALREIYLTEFVVYGDKSTNLAFAKLINHSRDVGAKNEDSIIKTNSLIKALNQCIRFSFTRKWDQNFEVLLEDKDSVEGMTFNCKS